MKIREWFLNKSIDSIRKKYPQYNEEKLEEISYGLEATYITFTKTIVIFAVAAIIGIAKDVLFVLLAYNIIRTTAFGMHAKKSWHCYLISGLLFIGTAIICRYCDINPYVKYLIGVISFIVLFRYAPADTYKRPLINKYKRERYKIITIIMGLVYLILIILFKNSIVSSYLCFGLLDASLMIHPLVYRMFQLPYDNYKNYIVTYETYGANMD